MRFRNWLRSLSRCWLGLALGCHPPAAAIAVAPRSGEEGHQDIRFGDLPEVAVVQVGLRLAAAPAARQWRRGPSQPVHGWIPVWGLGHPWILCLPAQCHIRPGIAGCWQSPWACVSSPWGPYIEAAGFSSGTRLCPSLGVCSTLHGPALAPVLWGCF